MDFEVRAMGQIVLRKFLIVIGTEMPRRIITDMPILKLASLGAQGQVYLGVSLVSAAIDRRKRKRIEIREKLGHDAESTRSQLMPLEKL